MKFWINILVGLYCKQVSSRLFHPRDWLQIHLFIFSFSPNLGFSQQTGFSQKDNFLSQYQKC